MVFRRGIFKRKSFRRSFKRSFGGGQRRAVRTTNILPRKERLHKVTVTHITDAGIVFTAGVGWQSFGGSISVAAVLNLSADHIRLKGIFQFCRPVYVALEIIPFDDKKGSNQSTGVAGQQSKGPLQVFYSNSNIIPADYIPTNKCLFFIDNEPKPYTFQFPISAEDSSYQTDEPMGVEELGWVGFRQENANYQPSVTTATIKMYLLRWKFVCYYWRQRLGAGAAGLQETMISKLTNVQTPFVTDPIKQTMQIEQRRHVPMPGNPRLADVDREEMMGNIEDVFHDAIEYQNQP